MLAGGCICNGDKVSGVLYEGFKAVVRFNLGKLTVFIEVFHMVFIAVQAVLVLIISGKSNEVTLFARQSSHKH